MKASILAVDDESAFLDSIDRILRIEGYDDVTVKSDPTEMPALVEEKSFDIAFLDITMPQMDGLDLLRVIKERSPQTECVMVTANESIPMVITAVKRGAYDYLVKPLVPVNMLALSPTLFESEFFGHVKGAFTGADREKTGYLAKAEGGTLFLDEIGDLSMEIRGKLLRILQEGEYTPVGETRSRRANVRFVAATNQDLDKLKAHGIK